MVSDNNEVDLIDFGFQLTIILERESHSAESELGLGDSGVHP